MESLTTMKEQAPAISQYVQGLLRDHSSETGPVQLYVDLIRKLLKAVGGKLLFYKNPSKPVKQWRQVFDDN